MPNTVKMKMRSNMPVVSLCCTTLRPCVLLRLYVAVVSTLKGFYDQYWIEVIPNLDSMNEQVLSYQAQAKKLPKVGCSVEKLHAYFLQHIYRNLVMVWHIDFSICLQHKWMVTVSLVLLSQTNHIYLTSNKKMIDIFICGVVSARLASIH